MKNLTSLRLLLVVTFFSVLGGCAGQGGDGASNTPGWLNVVRVLFGYVEPPKAESVMDSLTREYDRCVKIDASRNCVQLAYDQVRVTQGLDPKPIPKGYVVIVEDEIARKEAERKAREQKEQEQDQ
ncbi:hypothetical protein [Pleionea litopenaei]|uniref:Lipoprotein n=1 Tax=Pleionea litopenaei TaxID=3070815 RepID=A0AA51X5J3_9GAMM|nr:hypothetical protein [Pleionea sp. HL-JVS1]WMS85854.1 hypothetical protein Q9312_11560 [Pleionea sp. HL-JVS1]